MAALRHLHVHQGTPAAQCLLYVVPFFFFLHLTLQLENSLYRTHPSSKEPIGRISKNVVPNLEGDWSNLLSTTFKWPNRICHHLIFFVFLTATKTKHKKKWCTRVCHSVSRESMFPTKKILRFSLNVKFHPVQTAAVGVLASCKKIFFFSSGVVNIHKLSCRGIYPLQFQG